MLLGQTLRLVVPVSVHCDWVGLKVWSASPITVWQHVPSYKQIRSVDTLACCKDVKQRTTNKNLFEVTVMFVWRHCATPLTSLWTPKMSLWHPTNVSVTLYWRHCDIPQTSQWHSTDVTVTLHWRHCNTSLTSLRYFNITVKKGWWSRYQCHITQQYSSGISCWSAFLIEVTGTPRRSHWNISLTSLSRLDDLILILSFNVIVILHWLHRSNSFL